VLTPRKKKPTLVDSISPGSGRGHAGPGLGSVYPDLRILNATWRALSRREDAGDNIVIPADNRALVEEAVHSDVIDGITAEDERWEKHERYLDLEDRTERVEARSKKISFENAFTDPKNKVKNDVPTRLGEEDIMVTLTQKVETPFKNTTEQVTLSPYLFSRNPTVEDGEADPTQTADGFRFTFEGENFTYTSLGIQQE
jgi:CRISPR-associated endonuclease/helicase Cas3